MKKAMTLVGGVRRGETDQSKCNDQTITIYSLLESGCSGSWRAKISSTGTPKYLAILNAITVEGTKRPTSIVLIVFRDTFMTPARSDWLIRCFARNTRIRFVSSRLATIVLSRAVQTECARQLSLWIQLMSTQEVGKCAGRSREPVGRGASDKFEIVTSALRLR